MIVVSNEHRSMDSVCNLVEGLRSETLGGQIQTFVCAMPSLQLGLCALVTPLLVGAHDSPQVE